MSHNISIDFDINVPVPVPLTQINSYPKMLLILTNKYLNVFHFHFRIPQVNKNNFTELLNLTEV